MLTPELTYVVLLIAQALHLLHHRVAKRHISFVEVTAAAVLCLPTDSVVPSVVLMIVHLGLTTTQILGSLFINQLSPTHDGRRILAHLG